MIILCLNWWVIFNVVRDKFPCSNRNHSLNSNKCPRYVQENSKRQRHFTTYTIKIDKIISASTFQYFPGKKLNLKWCALKNWPSNFTLRHYNALYYFLRFIVCITKNSHRYVNENPIVAKFKKVLTLTLYQVCFQQIKTSKIFRNDVVDWQRKLWFCALCKIWVFC